MAEASAGGFEHAVVTRGGMGFLSAAEGRRMSTLDAFGVEFGSKPVGT